MLRIAGLGALRDELGGAPAVVGGRIFGQANDMFSIAPVMNTEDILHLLNTVQAFCRDTNGAGPHAADTQSCNLLVGVEPSPMMRYIYESDASGGADAGWKR